MTRSLERVEVDVEALELDGFIGILQLLLEPDRSRVIDGLIDFGLYFILIFAVYGQVSSRYFEGEGDGLALVGRLAGEIHLGQISFGGIGDGVVTGAKDEFFLPDLRVVLLWPAYNRYQE